MITLKSGIKMRLADVYEGVVIEIDPIPGSTVFRPVIELASRDTKQYSDVARRVTTVNWSATGTQPLPVAAQFAHALAIAAGLGPVLEEHLHNVVHAMHEAEANLQDDRNDPSVELDTALAGFRETRDKIILSLVDMAEAEELAQEFVDAKYELSY